MANILGNTVAGVGNFFGLPEFGISERLNNETSPAGQEYLSKTTQSPQNFNNGGALQSGQNVLAYNSWMPQGTSGASSQPTSGGGSIAGGGSASSGGSAVSAQPSGPDPFQQAINDAYNSTLNFLGQAEGNLRSQQGGIESSINNQFNVTRSNLGRERDISASEIDRSQQGGEARQEDALSAARRLFNELQTGGQQRFGGASSAGEAYSALAGRELMRNRQQITQNFNEFMGQVEQARTGLRSRFEGAMASLEQKKNDALGQAQRDFQDRLLSINQQKASAAGQKAQQQLAALQDLRNQVYQINLAQVSGTNAVNQLKQQAEQELASGIQSFTQQQQAAGQAGLGFQNQTTTNPTTAFRMGDQGPSQQMAFTGQINDDEEMRGSILRRPDEFNFA